MSSVRLWELVFDDEVTEQRQEESIDEIQIALDNLRETEKFRDYAYKKLKTSQKKI